MHIIVKPINSQNIHTTLSFTIRKESHGGMRERIYVCHTYYHVYVACLKELNLPVSQRKNADLILSTMSNDFEDLAARAENCGLFENVYMFDEKEDITFPQVMKYHKNHGNLILKTIKMFMYFVILIQLDIILVIKEYHIMLWKTDWTASALMIRPDMTIGDILS